jgi:hypothetical protein
VNGETSTSEDLTILAAVEALETGTGAPGGVPRPDEEAETLARLYNEVLGLIPYELEPVAPSPAARARLMAAIAGDETQPAPEPPRAAAPVAVPPGPVAPVRPPAPPTGEMRVPPQQPQRPAIAGTAARRRSRWPLTLAASLAVLGLALSGLLFWNWQQDRETIARLNRELTEERSRAAGAFAELRKMQSNTLDMRQKMELVTSPTVQVSALRPMGAPPLQPQARGMLFVAADHQHWYLSLKGLQPPQAGKVYKLWFMADQGPVGVSAFPARSGVPIELSSQEMPAGTRAAMITLESDPLAPAPTGPEVLRAGAVSPIG